MARYHFRTLGGLVLSRVDVPGGEITLSDSKALLLLAVLAMKPGYTARRVDLAELFWPEGDRPRALRALRQALFFLSQHADAVLLRDDDSVTLNAEAVTVDLWDFNAAIDAEDYSRAIDVHGGRFASGVERKVGPELEHWIESVDARVTVGVEVAYTREVAAALAAGDAARATQLARAFAAMNPLDDTRQALLARTLVTTGDRVGALQSLEEYRKVASPLLGDEPSPELDARVAAMREELLRIATAQEAVSAAPAPAAPPPGWQIAGHRVGRTTLLAGGGVVLAVVVGAVALASREGTAAADPFAGVQARLLAVVRRGNQAKVAELTVQSAGVTVADRNDLQPTDLPSPDGSMVATMIQAPDGWNLATRTASGEPRMLTTMPGDEYPLDWSPDGRYLLYAHRRLLADGRTESNDITVYDLESYRSWPLARLGSHASPTAMWSPDGTRVAFTADVRGTPDVFVIRFDGTDLRDLSRNPAWDGEPSWSPDHEHLAFISRRSGHAEVYVARADGGDLRRVTQTDREKHRPLWLSPTVLVFVIERDGAQALALLNTFTGQTRVLPGPDGLAQVLANRDRPTQWIASLVITPRTEVGSPGQHMTYGVDVRGPADTPFVTEGLPVDWTVEDRRVASIEGPGRILVVGPGRTEIVANAAGWRADTLTLSSIPLVAHGGTPAFAESWRRGADSSRWRLFGEPLPTTSGSGGPRDGGVFANRGDEFFASGAITRQAFPLKSGLSVEVEGRAPFTGRPHQEFGLALYPTQYPDSVLASGQAPAIAEFRMRGAAGSDPAQAWIGTGDWRETIPLPDDPGAWHRYCLQVLADGTVDLIVDGRLYWRSPIPLRHLAGEAYVVLGFQSFETRILHGPLRVYGAPRYELSPVSVAPSAPSP